MVVIKNPLILLIHFKALIRAFFISAERRWKSRGEHALLTEVSSCTSSHNKHESLSSKTPGFKLYCSKLEKNNNTKKTKVHWSLFDFTIFSKTSKERVASNSSFSTRSSLTCVNQLLE